MRFVVLLLSILLVSCATPKTAPQAYYGGVYAPGKVEFQSNGTFLATAGVISADDLATARKAAYARLMVSAKAKGYNTFEIRDEKTLTGLGKTFKLTGRAYKSSRVGDSVYSIDAIKRLLNDLPLAEPKPKIVAKKKPVRKVAKPVSRPTPVPEPVVTDEPTVIMAPTDITGSVKKVGISSETTSTVSGSITGEGSSALETPPALSGVPKGVVLRSK